jgi:hypothetical protein
VLASTNVYTVTIKRRCCFHRLLKIVSVSITAHLFVLASKTTVAVASVCLLAGHKAGGALIARSCKRNVCAPRLFRFSLSSQKVSKQTDTGCRCCSDVGRGCIVILSRHELCYVVMVTGPCTFL